MNHHLRRGGFILFKKCDRINTMIRVLLAGLLLIVWMVTLPHHIIVNALVLFAVSVVIVISLNEIENDDRTML